MTLTGYFEGTSMVILPICYDYSIYFSYGLTLPNFLSYLLKTLYAICTTYATVDTNCILPDVSDGCNHVCGGFMVFHRVT